ncbi:MAG: glyoxylate/hydroxypyruvate reductase A [Balneolaceae bacterium]
MSLLLIAPNRDMNPLKEALLEKDPNLDVELWPKIKKRESVTFAVSWKHPKNGLGDYPNLKAVSSLGAGVNHLLNDENIPESVKLCRIITSSLQSEMAEYVLNAITNYRLHTLKYFEHKKAGDWKIHTSTPKKDCAVGIMGLGEMGKTTAQLLTSNGYSVNGWANSHKRIPKITSFAGKEDLNNFLAASNILVCLLPLTEETEGILNLEVFKKLKKPSYLINVGRGGHLVEEDLIYALDTNALDGACLDVFETEPLPANHVFWNRPNIMITPHVAAITPANEAAAIIVENYKRALSGMELINEVSREKGY